MRSVFTGQCRPTWLDFGFEGIAARMIERETEGNNSTEYQNDQGDILQCFEHQTKECFRWFRWNFVAAESSHTCGEISFIAGQT